MDLIALLTGDSARYPPCPGIVGHQHNEPASETYECRERCAFGTPFFFVDLDNDVLTFFENLLDVDSFSRIGLFQEVLSGYLFQRQKAVALRVVIYEGGIETRLNAGNFTLVDVCFFLFS